MYRISQIKLNIDEPKELILKKIQKKTGIDIKDIKLWNIAKESLDARNKDQIKWIYTVDFELNSKNIKVDALIKNGTLLEVEPYKYEAKTNEEAKVAIENFELRHPIVIGFGPAGMFAALTLAEAGLCPMVLERGFDVDTRTNSVERFWKEGVLNPESNVQFGEGGAGTFSDGKLTTGTKDSRIRKVLEDFVKFGAPEEILYKQKPHIGTDVLKTIVKNLRNEIIKLGGEVAFNTKVLDFEITDGKIKNIMIDYMGRPIKLQADHVILAIGHSARDTFLSLNEAGVQMERKPFSIGVRVEHPQEIIDIAQYGKPGKELGLPPAEYKLSYRTKETDRGVYTFCMCPGGSVINAASTEKTAVTNGMSKSGRDSGLANSAVLCDVRVDDFESEDVLAGVRFQEKYEHLAYENLKKKIEGTETGLGFIPNTTWGELKSGNGEEVKNSLPGFAYEGIMEAMPDFGRKIKGFDADSTKIYAVESRSSSPVRILRDEGMESINVRGLYPVGEGAGYAGGITSAAVDGIKAAEFIIENIK